MGNGNGDNGWKAATVIMWGVLIITFLGVLANTGMLGYLVHQENQDDGLDVQLGSSVISQNALAELEGAQETLYAIQLAEANTPNGNCHQWCQAAVENTIVCNGEPQPQCSDCATCAACPPLSICAISQGVCAGVPISDCMQECAKCQTGRCPLQGPQGGTGICSTLGCFPGCSHFGYPNATTIATMNALANVQPEHMGSVGKCLDKCQQVFCVGRYNNAGNPGLPVACRFPVSLPGFDTLNCGQNSDYTTCSRECRFECTPLDPGPVANQCVVDETACQ